MPDYDKALQDARSFAVERYPEAAPQRHAAFANSVAYLVTGFSGGFGGPSLREHLVSWKLAGPQGRNAPIETNMGIMNAQWPDGTLPQSGHWQFDAACQFAEPLVFGPASDHRKSLEEIALWEHCFDDDPQDLAALETWQQESL
jgi:hypothetical protein